MHSPYDHSRLEQSSLVGLLRARAAERAGDVAFTFLSDGESESGRLSHGDLDRQARAIAVRLLRNARPGDRCLLVHEDGLSFLPAFFGCLYAGLVAVPVPAPEPGRLRRTAARMRAVAEDARPSIAATTAALLPAVREVLEPDGLSWLVSDEVDPALAESWEPAAETGDLAYLQYTSGSTSTPKGVMVSHRNVLANSARIRRAWGYDADSVAVMWVPHFHDDGLVHGLIQPLFSGFPSYLLPPVAVVQRPLRWLRAISHYRGTHSGGPNFAYTLAARKIRPEDRAGLDLSSWRVAYNAAEPIHAETLERFVRAFEPCGFRWSTFFPSYGLAEATLLVTTRDRAALPVLLDVRSAELEEGRRVVPAGPAERRAKTVVGCGRVVEETDLAIVDPAAGTRCADGEVGEVWVANPCVAAGYWNRPEATRETFGARLESGEGPFLRTGDLGFLRGGELYVTGRLKDLIVLRGRNHYPQDLELTAERSHPALRAGCGAAFAVEVGGEERLVLAQEVEGAAGLDVDDVAERICQAVAEAHDVQVYALALLPPRTIPKTSSGKIQRRGCRADLLAGHLEVVGSWRLGADACAGPEALEPLVSASSISAVPARETAAGGRENRAGELVAWLRDYAGERINSRLMDERRSIPPPVVLDFGNQGLFGLQVGREHGGLELGCRDTLRVLAQLGAIDLTLATLVVGHNSLGLRPIQRFATAETRAALLPELAAGRQLAAFALTEPGAGSNPRAISSTAVPDGAGGWRLNGHKVWSGSSSWAGVVNVFVQLREAGGAPAGIAGFAVRRGTPGLRPGPEAMTLGLRGMVQSAVHLDGVPVGPADLLGEPGTGFAVAQDAMTFTRLCLAAVSAGGIQRCAQLMLRYADRRTVATGRLLEHPVTRAVLGETVASAAAVEALAGLVAERLDRGEAVPAEVFAGCKIAGPELLWKAADALVQLLGGRGYVESGPAARLLRDARVFRIFEGPTEALRPFLGSSVLHGGGELDRFLRSLGAGAEADRLADAARRIEERCASAMAFRGDRVAALRWAHATVGDLATWSLLGVAAARSSVPAAPRAAQWAALRFAEELRQALAGSAREAAILAEDEALSWIEGFAGAIGDVEQTSPGEDWEPDPLLHGAARPQPRRAAAPAAEPAPITEDPELPAAGAEPIRAWLVEWLAEEVGLDPRSIDSRKPFSSLGLDSVTGVRMASELQSWLGRTLDATLAWDHPTIEALATHLGADGARPPVPEAEDETARLLRDIEHLSEEEALKALERELGGAL